MAAPKDIAVDYQSTGGSSVIRLKPRQYIHVLDNNSGVTRLEVGPQTITLSDQERLALKPSPMIVVPPRHYCIVQNPVLRDDTNRPQIDQYDQVRLQYGDQEIRFTQDPFPLYPGEELLAKVIPLQVVETNHALRLQAIRDFIEPPVPPASEAAESSTGIQRLAGDEWLFEGPATYIPRIEVDVLEMISAWIIKPNQALRLRARQNCVDDQNQPRRAGEEWLVREEGAYLPRVDEEVVEIVDAYVLTERKALHLRATRTFEDSLGQQRRAGDEWLVTFNDAEIHIPDVYEEVVGEVQITTLNDRQWCIVLDPIDETGKPQLGRKEIRQGLTSFFLHPGESLDEGIQEVYVLGEQEALLLKARELFIEQAPDTEENTIIERLPGDLWMISGPCDYIPPVQVEVVELRQTIPLDKNAGIYVRDTQTGELKVVSGPQTYMLSPYEELWEKELPEVVEVLLSQNDGSLGTGGRDLKLELASPTQRDRTRAVVYHVPQNSVVQIHDFKTRTARSVFGPDLVMLGPDEVFTVLSLSGGKPKEPHQIKTLSLFLGPDFMTDIFTVETSDHARLRLKLSYNWYFNVDHHNEAAAAKLFHVPDFVGDACKAIASRVRGAVAGVKFDEFHRNSARIIRAAVFGVNDSGHIGDVFRFDTNGLVITNIDIQSVEPVDEETLRSLQKSVQLAIQITTDAQEAEARQDAERIAQAAQARLERQGIVDRAAAEAERKELLEMAAENASIEAAGEAIAQAKAKAEAARIEGELAINLATQEAEATRIRMEAELAQLQAKQRAELAHQEALNAMAIEKAERMAEISSMEFTQRVQAIGPDTLKAIAQAGPEMQARLLEALGIQSVLITDGNSPVNLFNTAQGLINPAVVPSKKET